MDFGSLSSKGCLDSKKVHFVNLLHLCGFYPWVNTERVLSDSGCTCKYFYLNNTGE